MHILDIDAKSTYEKDDAQYVNDGLRMQMHQEDI